MPAKNGSKPATQADIHRLDTNIERLDKKIDRLGLEVFKIREESATHADLKELRDEISRNTSRILEAIDSFARKAEAYDRKALSHGHILQEHETKLRDHHRRLTSVEAKA